MDNLDIDYILEKSKSQKFFEGGFGFEKENVRVNLKGELAQTEHPLIFGNKRTHPYITTDFSESQIELISPVRSSVNEALGFIETLHDEVSTRLDNEYLWPQSVPPILPTNSDEISVAKFDSDGSHLEEYRNHLTKKYGKRKQMLSGVHFNVSFDENWLEHIHKSFSNSNLTFSDFREQVYLKTLRNFKRERWFLIALLGNTPVFHKSYMSECVDSLPSITTDSVGLDHQVSLRNSQCGYRNKTPLYLNYDSMKEYNKSLAEKIEKGVIQFEKENYASIRLKSSNPEQELTHLEVRLLDLNPLVKVGIDIEHAKIIHLYLVYCLLKPEANRFDETTQKRALKNHNSASLNSSQEKVTILCANEENLNLQPALEQLFTDIKETIKDILPDGYRSTIQRLERLVNNPKSRPGEIVLEHYKNNSFISWNITQAQKHLEKSKANSYNFFGLEDMELSTQLLIREAVMRGVDVDIMDRAENFIKLSNDKKVEYVMQATRTSLDNYSSVLLMENKVMTKKVLEDHQINTPLGKEYYNAKKAITEFEYFKNKPIVIKPKSTNFGIGITILKENQDKNQFNRAVKIAFEHDNTILIEHFVTGKEYRIFIINDEVVGILHRVPANVTGNGKLTIKELVLEKNKDSLRGKGYRTPLEKIALGEAELTFLQMQGLNFENIPEFNKTVFLRENSNISTGGDSLDFTDEMHNSYKEIAIEAAKALNVKITGLDMMIDDLQVPATIENYSIIEMNFNPAIHIHCHPFKGKNRHLNSKILDALGFSAH